jgi:hypothetical protein
MKKCLFSTEQSNELVTETGLNEHGTDTRFGKKKENCYFI